MPASDAAGIGASTSVRSADLLNALGSQLRVVDSNRAVEQPNHNALVAADQRHHRRQPD